MSQTATSPVPTSETRQERQERLVVEQAAIDRELRAEEQARVAKQAQAREEEKERTRQELADRQVMFSAGELVRQGMTPAEALRKAVEEQVGLGSTVAGTIGSLAKSLVEAGYTLGEARKAAAEAVLVRKRQEVEQRTAGERMEIAAELRLARLQKGLTQAQLADRAGVSERSVIKHEAGQALPSGLVASGLSRRSASTRTWSTESTKPPDRGSQEGPAVAFRWSEARGFRPFFRPALAPPGRESLDGVVAFSPRSSLGWRPVALDGWDQEFPVGSTSAGFLSISQGGCPR